MPLIPSRSSETQASILHGCKSCGQLLAMTNSRIHVLEIHIVPSTGCLVPDQQNIQLKLQGSEFVMHSELNTERRGGI
ncbi:hypothetical protein DAI22_12g131850 [Oryza sativa Japonica Group]|nr:hypothetical protein DAI22_12g131850 [Oryza sativa Japonica Group]